MGHVRKNGPARCSCRVKLYVARGEPNSTVAEQVVCGCISHARKQDVDFTIIDVTRDVGPAMKDGVLAAPTLIIEPAGGSGAAKRIVMIGGQIDPVRLKTILTGFEKSERECR